MNARFLFVVTASVLLGTGVLIQACGETETVTPPADAGPDVVDSGQQQQADTSTPSQDAAECDLSADFTDDIPDSAINDGQTTTGICIQCANRECAKQVGECNANCGCQELAGEALECFLQNSSNPTLCAAKFIGGNVDTTTQSIGVGLITCINSKCEEPCATEAFQRPDGGADSGGEATDAGEDAN